MSRKFMLIGACCGNNCGPQSGGQWGPVEFFKRIADNPEHPLHAIPTKLVYEHWCRDRTLDHYIGTGQFVTDLAEVVQWAILDGYFPIVIGGDHSCAIGTWRGVSNAHKEPLGMVWLDAHLDSHTDHTSHSGAIHGMPLAALTNSGHPALRSNSVDPARVAHVGARSFEPEEAAYAKTQGFHIEYFNPLDPPGKHAQLHMVCEAITHASRSASQSFGISIDLDGLDPKYAPAVSCPEGGGLDTWSVETALRVMLTGRTGRMLQAFEIAEFNPCIGVLTEQDIATTFDSLTRLVAVVYESLQVSE